MGEISFITKARVQAQTNMYGISYLTRINTDKRDSQFNIPSDQQSEWPEWDLNPSPFALKLYTRKGC